MVTFERRLPLPCSAGEVFAWHARPGAFERLVPPWERTEIVQAAPSLSPGARAVLRMWRGPFPIRWVAEHTELEEGRRFRDVQVRGPFARWTHDHVIEPAPGGGSVLVDRIDYALPLGGLGAAIMGGAVAADLSRAFRFRHDRTERDLRRHARFADRGPKRFVIGGASGLVGRALAAFLSTGGHEVVRLVRGAPGPGVASWDPDAGAIAEGALEGADVVVNLAGESVAGGRWTEERRRRILDSRVRTTSLLSSAIAAMPRKPVLVNASAIGIYGDRGDEELDEGSAPGDGFLADVCRAWEAATRPAEEAGARVVHARFGVILSGQGGALEKMRGPFSMGLGGPIGSGRQWMSVIDLDDAVGAVHAAAFEDGLSGPVNVVCPTPIRQRDFAKSLGRALGRPAIVPLPAFAVKAGMGRMGEEMLLASQRVLPKKLERAGFEFAHPDAPSSLEEQLGARS